MTAGCQLRAVGTERDCIYQIAVPEILDRHIGCKFPGAHRLVESGSIECYIVCRKHDSGGGSVVGERLTQLAEFCRERRSVIHVPRDHALVVASSREDLIIEVKGQRSDGAWGRENFN